MIKSELVQQLADENPHLFQRDIENIVNAILDEVGDAMGRGDRVELRGFGAFSVKNRPARVGRNPRTGEPMDLAASVNANPWVNVTAQASDAYMASFMAQVGANLKPNKIAFVEFSNEPWNQIFGQFHYLKDAAWALAGVRVATIGVPALA